MTYRLIMKLALSDHRYQSTLARQNNGNKYLRPLQATEASLYLSVD